MKFIEIQTESYDNEDSTATMDILLSVSQIVGVEMRIRTRHPSNERVLTPYIRTQDGNGCYCFNMSYQELRRHLLTTSNIIGTGGSVT